MVRTETTPPLKMVRKMYLFSILFGVLLYVETCRGAEQVYTILYTVYSVHVPGSVLAV